MGTLILWRLWRALRCALRRAVWVIVMESGSMYPLCTVFLNGGAYCNILSILSTVPRQCARLTSFLHPKLRETNAVLITPQLNTRTLRRLQTRRAYSRWGGTCCSVPVGPGQASSSGMEREHFQRVGHAANLCEGHMGPPIQREVEGLHETGAQPSPEKGGKTWSCGRWTPPRSARCIGRQHYLTGLGPGAATPPDFPSHWAALCNSSTTPLPPPRDTQAYSRCVFQGHLNGTRAHCGAILRQNLRSLTLRATSHTTHEGAALCGQFQFGEGAVVQQIRHVFSLCTLW